MPSELAGLLTWPLRAPPNDVGTGLLILIKCTSPRTLSSEHIGFEPPLRGGRLGSGLRVRTLP